MRVARLRAGRICGREIRTDAGELAHITAKRSGLKLLMDGRARRACSESRCRHSSRNTVSIRLSGQLDDDGELRQMFLSRVRARPLASTLLCVVGAVQAL